MARKQGMQKAFTPFEHASKLIRLLSDDEKIAIVKLIGADLGQQRLYSHSEVKQIVAQEIQNYQSRQMMDQTLWKGANRAIRTAR